MIGNNLLLGSGDEGYNLTRSLRTRASASAYLNRTPASAGNQKTWTYSDWIKRGALGTDQVILSAGQGAGTLYFYLRFLASDALDIFTYDSNTATFIWRLTTTQVFRDPSAWYHLVISTDTTQATAANRVKIYVNGTQVTAFTTASYPSLNYDTRFNANIAHYISSYIGSANFADCYQTEVNSIDGQALAPSSFGSTNTLTGVWQPAQYTGTYGTNGFYLPFTDNSALTTSSNAGLGKDFSGNGNYWTTNNISITSGSTYDSMTDVPTLTSATAANYCVLNPLKINTNGSLSSANLNWSASSTSGLSVGTIGVTSGKWYWETILTTSTNIGIGVFDPSAPLVTYIENSTAGIAYYAGNGNVYYNGGNSAYGNTFVANDIIGVALDLDNGKIYFSKNNTWQNSGNPVTQTNPARTGLSGTYAPAIVSGGGDSMAASMNFGQRPFTYTPPSGYVSLNAFNLPDSTIVKGNTVMDATLYTGTNATLSVTNAASFKPDLVWVKTRSVSSRNTLFDSVRGNTKVLWSDSTDAEGTATGGTGLTAFSSNGFTLGTEIAGTSGSTNSNGVTYVAWQWQAGQGTTSSNTSGSITSTVSVNASAGFSVVTYTGTGANATVGHGLGVRPSFIIVKVRNNAGFNWGVWHTSLAGTTPFITLNTTNSASTNSVNAFISANMTSSVIGFGNEDTTNGAYNYVAYCWTPIAGYSAFGSYNGSGSSDGPFIYTGFQPKWVLIKASSTTSQWVLWDTARNTYNVTNSILYPNLSAAEASFSIDMLSNGFKFREAGGAGNDSGVTYIYAAFATCPFKNSLAR